MCPYFRKITFIAAATALLTTGCSSSVKTGNLGQVELKSGGTQSSTTGGTTGNSETCSQPAAGTPAPGGMPVANRLGERFDGTAEEQIAQRSLSAWRTATCHDKKSGLDDTAWQKLREADEKDSMNQLTKLAKTYPTASTVQFMMGQVEEHFGKHEDAVKYYKAASQKNLISGMTLFKLAEEERRTGKLKDAIADYRKLLSVEPHFGPGQVGLAQCLFAEDKNSSEARSILQDVLANDPDNKEAKELLKPAKSGSSKSTN